MSLAEQIYRKLLWLYPKEHRRAYGRLMVQHAHDLSRAARRRGRLHLATLHFRLVIDGLVNAVIEHREALMTTKGSFQPVPWLSVLLAAVPGLLVALPGLLVELTRWNVDQLMPLLGGGYTLLMVIGLLTIWWRKRQFPVWGLLFAGMLTWFLTYLAGRALTQQNWIPAVFGFERGILFLNITLAIIFLVVALRGRRLPNKFWAIAGIVILGYILAATIYGINSSGGFSQQGGLQRFFISIYGPAEGLMLVAMGLLAARRYGVLAILFVIGGYLYMFTDSDYLFGYPMRDWSGLSTYLFSMSFFFLVMMPVALLRTRTRLGQATALFVPAILFVVARLVVPLLVMEQTMRIRPGDVMISINVLLSFILAWILYSYMGESARGKTRWTIREAATTP